MEILKLLSIRRNKWHILADLHSIWLQKPHILASTEFHNVFFFTQNCWFSMPVGIALGQQDKNSHQWPKTLWLYIWTCQYCLKTDLNKCEPIGAVRYSDLILSKHDIARLWHTDSHLCNDSDNRIIVLLHTMGSFMNADLFFCAL